MGREPPRRDTDTADDTRPAAPRQPPVVPHPVAAMQMSIGNAATTRLMRQPVQGTRSPVAEPDHPLAPPGNMMVIGEGDRPLVLRDDPVEVRRPLTPAGRRPGVPGVPVRRRPSPRVPRTAR